ncbi:Fasciclin-like arabinogalactan protein [Lachnellula occidentalis]|uniref:Fasciclin-like arabinogalactan protein n=1 Tax=Lachnellula occidentalis TaxID=215460 RepID=A0A8H8S4Q2_9HELO|nr:Fasciclin-like arabinogalactan protein [Lachnellula occidentalis]
MRSQSWRHLAVYAAALAFAVAGTNAQTGSLTDLGTLLSGQKNLTTFYGLIQVLRYVSSPFSRHPELIELRQILAPNNDAFKKIPYTELNKAFSDNDQDVITNVLEYHLLQGSRTAAELIPGDSVFIPTLLTNKAYSNVSGGQRVQNVKQSGDVVVFVSGLGNRCTLTQADLKFTGGVVQVIDSLLIPPSNLTETFDSFNLTAFEGALYQTKKLESFATAANSTIFVPNNDGFQLLGPAIANMTVEALGSVLDYHLLPGQVLYSTDLKNGTKLPTQNGGNITVLHSGNNLYVNSAAIVQADILCANGVIHVIDNVLNPLGPGAQPNPAIAEQGAVFASASEYSTLPFTTAIPCTTSCPVTSSSVASGSGVTGGAGTKATSAAGSKSSSVKTSSSKAVAAAMARETGFHAAGLMVALGGAVMMIG